MVKLINCAKVQHYYIEVYILSNIKFASEITIVLLNNGSGKQKIVQSIE